MATTRTCAGSVVPFMAAVLTRMHAGQGSLLADAPWLVATVRGWGAPSGARCASAPSHRNDSSHRSDSSRRNGSSRQSDASFRGSFARAEASGRIVRVQH
eukprot:2030472-Rhodomonas_salina.3